MLIKQSYHIRYKSDISLVVISPGSAETNVGWGGKIDGLLLARCVRNYEKLSKSDDWFSSYGRKCWGCFFGTQCVFDCHNWCVLGTNHRIGPSPRLMDACNRLTTLVIRGALIKAPLPLNLRTLYIRDSSFWSTAWDELRYGTQLTLASFDAVFMKEGTLAAVPRSVEYLRLHNCTFSAKVLLPDEGSATHNINELDICGDTRLKGSSFGRIALAFQYLPSFKSRGCAHYIVEVVTRSFKDMTDFDAEGARVLDSDVRHLPSTLKRLSLAGCPITDASITHIVNNLYALDYLNLSKCDALTDDGVGQLQNVRYNLTELNLKNLNIGELTVATLRQSRLLWNCSPKWRCLRGRPLLT